MLRKGELFAGLTVAIVTPFKSDDSVDYDKLKELVEWHIQQGTDCLAPMGTTGESPTVDHDEHKKIIKCVVEAGKGQIKVMGGTGSNSTQEAIELTKFAADVGCDGALMVGPYYNKPTQEGYLRHFEAVADAVALPIVLYNIPGRTGSNINPDTINKMGEHPNIVAIKEATGSMDQASLILGGSQLTLLSGDDSMTLPLMSLGASGVVSVVGNIVPKDIQRVVTEYQNGNIIEAQKAHYKLFALCKDLLTLATNPIPIKCAMSLLGMCSDRMRLPMCEIDEAGRNRIKKLLIEYGMIK